MNSPEPLNEEQRHYLAGFVSGLDATRSSRGLSAISPAVLSLPIVSAVPGTGRNPDAMQVEAQNRVLTAGGEICVEERAKRDRPPLDLWDEMQANAEAGRFPKGADILLYKFHGLFYVAPAQNSFMCRLRFPAGVMRSHQMRGVAELAEQYGGGYSHVTTRANLQIREIGPAEGPAVLMGLHDLGIVNRGAGADSIRNITASPTAGFDAQELFDTGPMARQLHHHILHHRDLYGLPRKFNIAFDGGGRISALAETNDIGFVAVRVGESQATEQAPPGIYFRMEVGGITGHRDFARDVGIVLTPSECLKLAAAAVRVFIRHGNRTDRAKARLKYLLDSWGIERFMQEVEKDMGFSLVRFPLDRCEARGPVDPMAHLGFHPQTQAGLHYCGVVLPVGRMTCTQMRVLADIADRYGRGEIRLTVWQNLLVPHIAGGDIEAVQAALHHAGLDWKPTAIRAGLVACTGNTGCRFAAADTKGHALALAEHLEARLALDHPLNIHVTGCHHSCAQHYIGDIGLLATTVERGDDLVEGFHVHLGGGSGEHRRIGREVYRNVPADQLPELVERMIRAYLQHRRDSSESFCVFVDRHETTALARLFDEQTTRASA